MTTTAQVPHFIWVLSLAKIAYELAHESFGRDRLHERPFPGATPRRRKPTSRYIELVLKRSGEGIRPYMLGQAERRILIAAWDLGLAEKQIQEDELAAATPAPASLPPQGEIDSERSLSTQGASAPSEVRGSFVENLDKCAIT